MKEKIINFLIEKGFSFDPEDNLHYLEMSNDEEVFAVIEAEFPENKPDTVIFTYNDEKGRRGCDIAFSDLEKYDITEISSVIDKLVN